MLSQTTGYAITALGCLAEHPEKPQLVRQVAQATGIPAPYLGKIINTLAHKGLVVTQRGIGGGVMLAAAPETITLYDIAAALDDPLLQKRCMLGNADCSDERACPAHTFWKAHRDTELAFLHQRTLKDVACFEKQQRNKQIAKESPRKSNRSAS